MKIGKIWKFQNSDSMFFKGRHLFSFGDKLENKQWRMTEKKSNSERHRIFNSQIQCLLKENMYFAWKENWKHEKWPIAKKS